MAPTYEFRFLVTEARTKAVREEHPKEFFDAYSRLAVGAAQADLWRVLTLHKHGGVYMDIDAHLVWPLHRIVRPGHEELFITVRDEGLSNFFIAARAGSPRLAEIAQRILANIKAPPENNVFKITGPMVFREVLDGKDIETVSARITCHQGNFSNEFFQYVDKKGLKWSDPEAKKIKVVRD